MRSDTGLASPWQDHGDRLSPILVKELRQATRSQLFNATVILLQAMLLLFGLSTLASRSFAGDAAASVTYWLIISIPLLVVIPLSAAQALQKERRGKTLELLLLTRLSAYRIVIGKWASSVAQTTLVLTTALPYFILRYFVGSIEIWHELAVLLGLWIASALLTGIAMGFWSTGLSRPIKWLLTGLAMWGTGAVIDEIGLFKRYGAVAAFGSGDKTELIIAGCYTILLLGLMLEVAARSIAPPAENHSSRMRLLALAGLALPFCWSAHPREGVRLLASTLAMAFFLPTAVAMVSEPLQNVPGLYATFTGRRGPIARWLSKLLCPGWPGGSLFMLLGVSIYPLMPLYREELNNPFLWVSLVATLMVPLVVVQRFWRDNPRLPGYYLLVMMASGLPVYIWAFAKTLRNQPLVAVLETLAGLFPLSAFILELDQADSVPELGFRHLAICAMTLVTIVYALRMSADGFRQIRDIVERRDPQLPNARLNAPPPQPEPGPVLASEAGDAA